MPKSDKEPLTFIPQTAPTTVNFIWRQETGGQLPPENFQKVLGRYAMTIDKCRSIAVRWKQADLAEPEAEEKFFADIRDSEFVGDASNAL